MSYLLRWVRHNQSLAIRSRTLMINGNILETNTASSSAKPLYQIIRTQPIMTPSPALLSPPPPPPKQPLGKINKDKDGEAIEKKDDIEYVIRFQRGIDVKKLLKDFYSLYGPLFAACYIGVGLTSLGFFCSLTYLAVDLSAFIPDFVYRIIGETMADMTGTGGKFVVAYAIHKVLLPLRLGAAIYITRNLSRVIKRRKRTREKGYPGEQ